jgi:hypothetical protein
MDDRRFDNVIREFGTTRRAVLGLLTGVLGTVLGAGLDAVAAKKRCVPEGGACPASELDC